VQRTGLQFVLITARSTKLFCLLAWTDNGQELTAEVGAWPSDLIPSLNPDRPRRALKAAAANPPPELFVAILHFLDELCGCCGFSKVVTTMEGDSEVPLE
jgi:hypothetical protein